LITSDKGVCTKLFSLPKNTVFYAWTEEDLFLCKDGYGLLVSASSGQAIDPFKFESGLYQCGSKNGIKSLRAGAQCSTEKDCPSNVNGTFAQCECSYGTNEKVCGILHENAEFTDYLQAVCHLIFNIFRSKTSYNKPNIVITHGLCFLPRQMMLLTTPIQMALVIRNQLIRI
jgi:hypothetical protein